jgi:hypothetical protein
MNQAIEFLGWKHGVGIMTCQNLMDLVDPIDLG